MKTLILIKPDAVQRKLAGKIVSRLEDKGLQIIGMKMLQITKKLAALHYVEHVAKGFYPALEAFITSSPVIAIVVEGPKAISVVRTMVGATNGQGAAPGTIRGDYGISQSMNLIHASDTVQSAAREIELYFQPSELMDYKVSLGDSISDPGEV